MIFLLDNKKRISLRYIATLSYCYILKYI